MEEQTLKRFAVFTAAAGLSTWAIDMAATQVGLPSMQADLGISVTASQWILNLTLMILAGIVTVGGALGDRFGRMRMFRWASRHHRRSAHYFWRRIDELIPHRTGRAGLGGLAAAFFLPASTALLLDVFPMAERGGAQGKMMMISMFITAFAPRSSDFIIQAVSWPYAYLLTWRVAWFRCSWRVRSNTSRRCRCRSRSMSWAACCSSWRLF